MPLANCPDCGERRSTEAIYCPNCGKPGPRQSWPSKEGWYLWPLFASLFGTIAGGLIVLFVARQTGLSEPVAHFSDINFYLEAPAHNEIVAKGMSWHNTGDVTARNCKISYTIYDKDPSDTGAHVVSHKRIEVIAEIRPDKTETVPDVHVHVDRSGEYFFELLASCANTVDARSLYDNIQVP